jgi:hypothetical protein
MQRSTQDQVVSRSWGLTAPPKLVRQEPTTVSEASGQATSMQNHTHCTHMHEDTQVRGTGLGLERRDDDMPQPGCRLTINQARKALGPGGPKTLSQVGMDVFRSLQSGGPMVGLGEGYRSIF